MEKHTHDNVVKARKRLQRYIDGAEAGYRKVDIEIILKELDRHDQKPTEDWA